LASTHRLTSLDGVSCVSALDTYLRVRQRQSNDLHTRVDTKAAAWTARKTVNQARGQNIPLSPWDGVRRRIMVVVGTQPSSTAPSAAVCNTQRGA